MIRGTMEAIKASKSGLRKEIKDRLSSLTSESKRIQTDIVLKKLFSLPDFQNSTRISVYLSTKYEISTEPILRKIFEANKTCFVPRYNKNTMEMVQLDCMHDYECLPMTKWNIKQPNLTDYRENAIETGGLDLIIVPGVAFTPSGHRLGHGKGYYDMFLANYTYKQHSTPKTVGLAFKEQIMQEIPVEEHDIKIDTILCPEID